MLHIPLCPCPNLGFGEGMDKAFPTQSGGDGFLIVRSNATYHGSIAAKTNVTSVSFRTVLLITQYMFPCIFLKLISFILTRRGGPFGVLASSWWSHKSWNWWIRKTRSSIYACYYNISQKITNRQICHTNQQWHQNMICLDMVWDMLIHCKKS